MNEKHGKKKTHNILQQNVRIRGSWKLREIISRLFDKKGDICSISVSSFASFSDSC